MSYRSSRARREFEKQLGEALMELRPLYKMARQSAPVGGARLLAAYYVFAFAQLEVYVKTLVEDALNAVTIVKPPLNSWPDQMLAYLLHESAALGREYQKFSVHGDEGPLLKKIGETAREIVAWDSTGLVPTPLVAAAFMSNRKYPSPDNLSRLFKRLGLDVWPTIDKLGRMNCKLILKSLNDLRTEIAHEGRTPTGFGFSDFNDRLSQMRRLVSALDRGVAHHFCKSMLKRAKWNGNVA